MCIQCETLEWQKSPIFQATPISLNYFLKKYMYLWKDISRIWFSLISCHFLSLRSLWRSIDILNLPPIWNSFSLEIFRNMDYKCKFIIILTLFRVFKVDCLTLTLFWVPNLSSVAQIEWKKHPYIYFLLSVQK